LSRFEIFKSAQIPHWPERFQKEALAARRLFWPGAGLQSRPTWFRRRAFFGISTTSDLWRSLALQKLLATNAADALPGPPTMPSALMRGFARRSVPADFHPARRWRPGVGRAAVLRRSHRLPPRPAPVWGPLAMAKRPQPVTSLADEFGSKSGRSRIMQTSLPPPGGDRLREQRRFLLQHRTRWRAGRCDFNAQRNRLLFVIGRRWFQVRRLGACCVALRRC